MTNFGSGRGGREAGQATPASPRRIGSGRRRADRRRGFEALRTAREAALRPEAARLALVFVGFVALVSVSLIWARETFVPAAGRAVDQTRLVRVDFSVEDVTGTQKAREVAQQMAPRVYQADRALLESIESGLFNLPSTLAQASTLDDVAREIRESHGLTPELFAAIRSRALQDGEPTAWWTAAARELMDSLRTRPVLQGEDVQRELTSAGKELELRAWDQPARRQYEGQVISLSGERFGEDIDRLVRRAGFPPDVAPAVSARLRVGARPTYVFDEAETQALSASAAASVKPALVQFRAGDVLARRGETLSDGQRGRLLAERDAWARLGPPLEKWRSRLGIVAAVTLATGGVAAYLGLHVGGWSRDPRRAAALAATALLSTFAACWLAVATPSLLALAAAAPTAFLAIVATIALGQRPGIAIASVQALLVALGLSLGPGAALVGVAGSAAAAWRLREVRSRKTMIRAGVSSAGALAMATLAWSLIEGPGGALLLRHAPIDAGLAAVGGLFVAFLALGLLPLIERAFGVVTGMTLMELRDPKHPLLRELAQRAPGTYTHSMTVATLAEAAADAVGADGLHVYVGALYHDIGKMLKPDYFVENMAGAVSRHERLSPAMSLLIIVGHVKDGVELAREHSLPRSIQHYIESHHGTTLVEYFYHRAKERAEEAGDERAEQALEVGYRYPGPKPRTKEAAILMLCDAVESASRALAEPNPSRIESLVGAISGMRLTDGQFDECDLTLRELHMIEQAIIKSLNAIYHARIVYPSTAESGAGQGPRTGPKSGAAAAAAG